MILTGTRIDSSDQISFDDVFDFYEKDLSFIQTLKKMFEQQLGPEKVFNRLMVGEIWQACLEDESTLPGTAERILNKTIRFLSTNCAREVLSLYEENRADSQAFSDALLLYAEGLRRDGFDLKADNIQRLAIKGALLPKLLELNKASRPDRMKAIAMECFEKIEALDQKIVDLTKLSAPKIPASYVEALIQKIVPKKTLKRELEHYVTQIRPHLQKSLEKSFFHGQKASFLQMGEYPLSMDPQDQRKPLIWIYNDLKGVYLVFCDNIISPRKRYDQTMECLFADVFIPHSRSEWLPQAQTSISIVGLNIEEALKELENRESVSTLPLAERYFAPLPIVNQERPYFVKKASGYQSLQSAVSSLSAVDLLQVCKDITSGVEILASAGRISLDIHPDNISFKKEDECIAAQIDHFLHLSVPETKEPSSNKRLNFLAKEGHISFETDRFALVLLIAEAFFLNLDDGLSLDVRELEAQVLKNLEETVYFPHYQKVLEIKDRYGGFLGDFSKDLLQYVEKIKEEGEESFQFVALERFALKMAIFPEVSSLLLETLEVDKAHQDLRLQGRSCSEILSLDPKIPTLERIQGVLEEAKLKLESLPRSRNRTSFEGISYLKVKEIVTKILPPTRASEVLQCSVDLHRVLSDCLEESPYVGSEFRLHKNTTWRDGSTLVPLSMWVRIQKDRMTLEIFPAGTEPLLGLGGLKKVKPGISVEILNEGPPIYDFIAISRLNNGIVWEDLAEGHKIQEKILRIPGAERYFIGLSKKHAPHQVGDKTKLESIFSRFKGTLYEAIQSQSVEMEEGLRFLSPLDFISFLENVAFGIRLIAGEGLSHGDIKVMNTALISKMGNLSSRVFDFDMASEFKRDSRADVYWAWNTLRQEYGMITAETDLYSYSLMVVETLLFDFGTYLKGTNEEILRDLRAILDDPSYTKKRLRRKHVEEMHSRFPSLIKSNMISFFSNPPTRAGITDVHEGLFTQIKQLQKEGKTVETIALKRFLSESLFFEWVFSLLTKTLRADVKSKENMEENLETLGTEEAAKKALEEAGFPTLDEIQHVLDECKAVVLDVDDRCTEKTNWLSSFFGTRK